MSLKLFPEVLQIWPVLSLMFHLPQLHSALLLSAMFRSTVKMVHVFYKSSISAAIRGLARLFKMRGRQGGSRVSRGGADWDSKWQLSIDFCTKCNFIWGEEGGQSFCQGGGRPRPPLATPLAAIFDGDQRLDISLHIIVQVSGQVLYLYE